MPLFRGNAQKATSALIAAIYDAALDPRKWQDFVDALPLDLDGVEPVLYVADTRTAIMESLLVSDGWGDAFLADYMARYNALNPWTPHLKRAPAIGIPVSGDQVISDGDFRRTEFYNDFFRRYWDWPSVVGVVNFRDSNAFSVLGLHCTQGTFERHRPELLRLIGQLSPHITRAFEISRQLGHGAARRASLEAMIDGLTSAALLVGADLRVRHANEAARRLFRSGALSLDRRGRIAAAAEAEETGQLRLALAEALAGTPDASAPSAVKLTRPSDEARGNLPLLARVMPCGGGQQRPPGSPTPPLSPTASEPEALVLIADPAARLHVDRGRLRQLFGLTPAEARLAQALAQGMSLQGFAAAAGITDGTARVELKSVFAKTGTHRQAELVTLLAQLARTLRIG